MSDKVTINKDEYLELLNDQLMLSALEAVGVDSWEGYSEAQENYDTWKKEKKAEKETEDRILPKVLEEVSLIVGGSHSTIMFTADEVIMAVQEAINIVEKKGG